eukprot:ANDGO_05453.mRNA.1 hypothetical protein
MKTASYLVRPCFAQHYEQHVALPLPVRPKKNMSPNPLRVLIWETLQVFRLPLDTKKQYLEMGLTGG